MKLPNYKSPYGAVIIGLTIGVILYGLFRYTENKYLRIKGNIKIEIIDTI